jgi:hypothetical protein
MELVYEINVQAAHIQMLYKIIVIREQQDGLVRMVLVYEINALQAPILTQDKQVVIRDQQER